MQNFGTVHNSYLGLTNALVNNQSNIFLLWLTPADAPKIACAWVEEAVTMGSLCESERNSNAVSWVTRSQVDGTGVPVCAMKVCPTGLDA